MAIAQGDLFARRKYPRSPGWKEKKTSKAAATAMAPRAPKLRDRVLAAIVAAGARGMTADEAARAIGETEFAIRPRLTELGPRHAGKIVKTGGTRRNFSGASAAVWIAAEQQGTP